MELIVASDHSRDFEKDRTYLGVLIQEGLNAYHLRKPKASKKQIKEFLNDLPNHYHSKIVLHSYPELLKEYSILRGYFMGNKYSAKSLSTWIRRKSIRYKHKRKSLARGFSSGQKLVDHGHKYDYVFFGPVFTMKKGGRMACKFDEMELKFLLKKAPIPVMARGGITLDNLDYLLKVGFDGCVLQTALWDEEDPISTYRTFKEKVANNPYAAQITPLSLT